MDARRQRPGDSGIRAHLLGRLHVSERGHAAARYLARNSARDEQRPQRAWLGMKKDLRIGLVGYGFMGRTHSNAFLQVSRFFDVPYRPVLKAVCARNAERVKAFAANWGYESVETAWRSMV